MGAYACQGSILLRQRGRLKVHGRTLWTVEYNSYENVNIVPGAQRMAVVQFYPDLPYESEKLRVPVGLIEDMRAGADVEKALRGDL